MRSIMTTVYKWLDCTRAVDFLAPLALRLYLVPVFWMAGTQKFNHIESTIQWFGNAEWGLGLPYPTFMAYSAMVTEIMGAIFLLIGFATRWISLPLMIVMIIAAVSVHWDNGWYAIAESSSEASLRLNGFLEWLNNNHDGRHGYITELGKPVILQNGIEFAVTYCIMLMTLFFIGSGKYVSVDYWFKKRFIH